jgi:hypothetical protein
MEVHWQEGGRRRLGGAQMRLEGAWMLIEARETRETWEPTEAWAEGGDGGAHRGERDEGALGTHRTLG